MQHWWNMDQTVWTSHLLAASQKLMPLLHPTTQSLQEMWTTLPWRRTHWIWSIALRSPQRPRPSVALFALEMPAAVGTSRQLVEAPRAVKFASDCSRCYILCRSQQTWRRNHRRLLQDSPKLLESLGSTIQPHLSKRRRAPWLCLRHLKNYKINPTVIVYHVYLMKKDTLNKSRALLGCSDLKTAPVAASIALLGSWRKMETADRCDRATVCHPQAQSHCHKQGCNSDPLEWTHLSCDVLQNGQSLFGPAFRASHWHPVNAWCKAVRQASDDAAQAEVAIGAGQLVFIRCKSCTRKHDYGGRRILILLLFINIIL